MLLQELKTKIERSDTDYAFMIFKLEEPSFLAEQYYLAIAKNLGYPIEYVADLTPFYSHSPFMEKEVLYIHHTDELCLELPGLEANSNLIIVCNKVNKSSNLCYNTYIIDFPKLENWQIKDFVYSSLEGIATSDLDWLIGQAGFNNFRLALEVDKLKLFSITERPYIFKLLKLENGYSDLTQFSVYDLSNALINRDIDALKTCYQSIDPKTFNIIGCIQLLYTNFRNIISIQLSKFPNIPPKGMSQKQYYAIKHNVNMQRYNKEQLLKIFAMLTSIDQELKLGNINTDFLLNYIISFILGV